MTHYIGIDPSFRKNGFAICIIGGGEADFKVFNGFLEFAAWLKDYKEAQEDPDWEQFKVQPYFCIENSNLQALSFDMSGSKSVACKKSRDVGKNMAISQCTVDYCRLIFGKDFVFEVSPLEKGSKKSDLIVRSVALSSGINLTNYKGKENEQDKRDAFMLAMKIYKKNDHGKSL
jgi:hypothetical protein